MELKRSEWIMITPTRVSYAVLAATIILAKFLHLGAPLLVNRAVATRNTKTRVPTAAHQVSSSGCAAVGTLVFVFRVATALFFYSAEMGGVVIVYHRGRRARGCGSLL